MHLLLYYYCLCKSFNELFHLLQDNFVPESGCKGIKKINNTQAFLRKISTKIATFFLFLTKRTQNKQIHLIYIYVSIFAFEGDKNYCADVLLQHITDKKRLLLSAKHSVLHLNSLTHCSLDDFMLVTSPLFVFCYPWR